MFKNINKKIILGTMAAGLALSGSALSPALVFAKDNHGAEVRIEAKKNHGQEMKAFNKIKHELREDHGFHWGFSGLLSSDVLSTVSQDSIRIFKAEMKDAITDKKEAQKEAKVALKASLKTSDTPEEKKTAVKTFLNSILSAFHIFADAKEAAMIKFIASF